MGTAVSSDAREPVRHSASWQLAADWPVFAGHFPDQPILPGALLLDWVVGEAVRATGRAVLAVPQAKFLDPALPGDQLMLNLEGTGERLRFEVHAHRPARRVSGAEPLGAGEHDTATIRVASGQLRVASTSTSESEAAS